MAFTFSFLFNRKHAISVDKRLFNRLLYPTSMQDLLAVADDNQIMPPKSTWFEPKLLSGLLLHDLETR